MSEKDKLVTAYHESGHVIVGHVLAHADPIHKVSIVARSRSLGLTFTLPEDKYNHSRSELRDAMAMCLGGRSAEELIFEEPTTGAENDIEKATTIARAMVTEYGMSDLLGPQKLGQKSGEVFLGRDFGHEANYSEQVAASIDAEVRRMIDEAPRAGPQHPHAAPCDPRRVGRGPGRKGDPRRRGPQWPSSARCRGGRPTAARSSNGAPATNGVPRWSGGGGPPAASASPPTGERMSTDTGRSLRSVAETTAHVEAPASRP